VKSITRALRTAEALQPQSALLRGRANAFTIVELLVVIAIIGLIVTVVAVSWQASLPRAELNSTLHELAAAINGARSDAIARNGEFRMYYDIDASSYLIKSPYKLGGGLALTEEERVIVKRARFPESINLERVTISGIEYTDGVVFASFDPQGSATGHTLTLVQAITELPTTIEVLPLTGLVRFHEGNFQRELVTEEDFD
jgi:prepilin-type N-terminal cleavage/methylation domain-containing protein